LYKLDPAANTVRSPVVYDPRDVEEHVRLEGCPEVSACSESTDTNINIINYLALLRPVATTFMSYHVLRSRICISSPLCFLPSKRSTPLPRTTRNLKKGKSSQNNEFYHSSRPIYRQKTLNKLTFWASMVQQLEEEVRSLPTSRLLNQQDVLFLEPG
jgi:hypothetical protein